MAASNSGGGGPLSAESAAALGEGVRLVFGRWTALQMAVENQWGGRDSRAKADQLGESILSWFCHSKGKYYSLPSTSSNNCPDLEPGSGPHYFEDLVDMMYDTISESFNADFEDASVEEVAVDGNDDSDSSDDEDDESMMDVEAAAPAGMAVDKPKPSKAVPDADGWTTVPPKRGRGKN
ncbi:hypothetical protein PR202_gb29879 [Eleusine coracana subsp. coracana]|uniref:Pre-rRNA-processing protein TSR2 n=1 Tax=Eleusine coracana subsp. coracana TaxID=191504 RepID=A0AAV5FY64_ELECO|nr:hypothetical protein PR202_gb29879 [Eleusine coracana subsp. coracana]